MKNILITASVAILIASCGSNYQKTQSGLLYKVVSKGSGPQVKIGEFLKVNFSQKVGDSLVISSFDNGMPAYVKVDSVGPIYNILEILPGLHRGDSVMVVELPDSLEKRGMLPPYMTKKQKRTWNLTVVDIIKDMEAMRNDQQAELTKYEAKQKALFESFMAGKKGTLQKTSGGVYVEVKEPGNGAKADTGKVVSVKYTGRFMPSEKVFESNMDDPQKQAYPVLLGSGGVIRGWEEGLQLFHAGGKGRLYVPYELAYGNQAGPGGMPFQNLIFDVEIVDVKDAPPPAPPMQMPPVLDTTTKKK